MSSPSRNGGETSAAQARMCREIEARVEFDPNAGCWLWARGLTGNGYGSTGFKGFDRPAHRASWQAHKGAIPPGLRVLHRCDTPSCVNPHHLFLGTHAENMADCATKGRINSPTIRSPRPRGPACRRGHPYTGRGECAECRRGRNAKIAAARKAARSAGAAQ